MVGRLDQHVLEVDGLVGGQSPLPLGVDLPVELEEQPGPEAIEVAQRSEASRRSRSSAVHEFDLTWAMKVRTSRARSSCFMGFAHSSLRRPVRVPVEAQPEPGELVLELGEAVTEHDVGPGGLDEGRPVLGV